jgi:hypothetical protein
MKYRVTANMPANIEGYKAGDVIEYDPAVAALSLAKGYIEPLEMVELKKDTMVKHARHKELT